ncbi:hypothetical protein PInf_002143 [Phytophthora infestans]|nr:hypothetical protein PInf_002143 [Phytophthora infestans]
MTAPPILIATSSTPHSRTSDGSAGVVYGGEASAAARADRRRTNAGLPHQLECRTAGRGAASRSGCRHAPVVAQMLPQPSVLKMAGVREGDLLISVNGKKTTRLGYEKVVRLLFKERLPMVLHFRSPLQVPEMQRGVSGAIAEEPSSARGGRSRACSSSRPSQQPKSRSRGRSDVDTHALIEQKRNPNRTGTGMDRVCVNDVLISINGEKTKALGVEKVLRWLHVIEKPVVLRFHASSNRILNPAGGLLPQLADEDASERPRRPTMPLPLPQPEYEPPPRPPRRNNSVDQPMPQQRMERGYSDDREYELQPAIAPRRYSRDSATYFEQQPIETTTHRKPKEECEFGGVPLLDIKEGTVQAKLMYIYAKACLAKEGSSDDEPAPKDPQPSRTPGTRSDDAVASNPILSQTNGDAGHDHKVEPEEHKLDVINDVNSGHELKRSGIFSDNLDESFAKMQKDISIQQPPIPVLTPSLSSAGPSSPVSSDATPTVTPAPAPVTPAEDFISLKDFVMKGDGRLSERHTPRVSTVRRRQCSQRMAARPIRRTSSKISSQQWPRLKKTTIEASSGLMLEELKSSESKETVRELVVDELEVAEPMEASGQETEEHADETLHEEDDAASVDSSNERDLAASVASLDDLLDLKDGNHDDEEHEEFVDDDEDEQESEKNEKSDANEKETMNTSLGMKLDQVQEEETDDHDVHAQHEKEQEQEGHEAHDDDLENEDGALSNPLVNELFRNIPDVRQVIKDKPALVVLRGRQSLVARTSKKLAPSEAGRLSADEDALDEALKYSFHDSAITREDMIHPWRYLQGSDSISSSIRDSNDSSITSRTDEVWL